MENMTPVENGDVERPWKPSIVCRPIFCVQPVCDSLLGRFIFFNFFFKQRISVPVHMDMWTDGVKICMKTFWFCLRDFQQCVPFSFFFACTICAAPQSHCNVQMEKCSALKKTYFFLFLRYLLSCPRAASSMTSMMVSTRHTPMSRTMFRCCSPAMTRASFIISDCNTKHTVNWPKKEKGRSHIPCSISLFFFFLLCVANIAYNIAKHNSRAVWFGLTITTHRKPASASPGWQIHVWLKLCFMDSLRFAKHFHDFYRNHSCSTILSSRVGVCRTQKANPQELELFIRFVCVQTWGWDPTAATGIMDRSLIVTVDSSSVRCDGRRHWTSNFQALSRTKLNSGTNVDPLPFSVKPARRDHTIIDGGGGPKAYELGSADNDFAGRRVQHKCEIKAVITLCFMMGFGVGFNKRMASLSRAGFGQREVSSFHQTIHLKLDKQNALKRNKQNSGKTWKAVSSHLTCGHNTE